MRTGLRPRVLSTFDSLPAFLAGAVCFAFAIRLVVVVCLLFNVSSHTINYNDFGWESWEMGWTARSIFLGQGFTSPFLPVTGPTALVPPLYPYILAGVFKVFGLNTIKVAFAVLGFNSLCSALTCIPLYFLARNSLNDRAGRIAAIGWALYPFAIYFAADRVWDYAVTGLLFTSCLVLAQKLHTRSMAGWAAFGALYGLAVLSNPSVVSLLPLVLIFAIYKVWKAKGQWLTKGLAASLAFIAVCTPWTIRNERVMHSHFFLRDGIWLEAYAGNNGDTRESNSAWAHPASNPIEMKKYEREGEVAYMAEKRHLTIDFVKTHPGFFVEATARRIVRFWTGYWSFRPDYLKYEPFDLPNVPFCLFLLVFMIRGLKRWWDESPIATLPYLLALLVFPIPYYLTHSSMDYRQPIEPMILMLVTVGLFGTRSAVSEREEDALLPGEMEPEAEAVLV
ncbi:MAG TPA: glycosyltransferase family 39 protein [Acidobacteriaceae bacterium]|jgi:4-amino-4-deoxy-L-arabinose transferase-like glycosyltransferase